MPILHVRNVSADLYSKLGRAAKAHGRSLSAEVIALLEEGVDDEGRRMIQQHAMEDLLRLAESIPPRPPGADSTDSTDWIREERDFANRD